MTHREIENINRNLAMGRKPSRPSSTARSRLPSALFHTLHLYRLHSHVFLSGVAKFLFIPLAEP